MAQTKNHQESRLKDLIASAERMNISVRTEKLLREAGYRVRSGRCRIKGKDMILLDRDAPLGDQIEFLASELAQPHTIVDMADSRDLLDMARADKLTVQHPVGRQ